MREFPAPLKPLIAKTKGENMQKTVHVNAYTKRDGTHVKEHERIIDVVLNSRGCFPNDTKLPKIGLPEPFKNSI